MIGGFTIGPRGLPHEQLTVTPMGLITLLGVGCHLDESRKDIIDKAKADLRVKFLVCSQGFLLIIQCITRHAQGLPVTLLEIHIMMHVVCPPIMYGFWFDAGQSMSKPAIIAVGWTARVISVLSGAGCRYFWSWSRSSASEAFV